MKSYIMKYFGCCLLLGVNLSLAAAKPSSTKDSGTDPKKAAAERLKGEFDSLKEFEAAAADAETAGVSRQTTVEMKLVYCIHSQTLEPLPKIVAELEQILPTWREPDSLLFKARTDLEGCIFLVKGLLAEEANDESAFEHAMKEAFWLDPELAQTAAERIIKHREAKRMKTVVVPMDTQFETASGLTVSLGDLVRGQKALLLDFWASWCGPCMKSMDELASRAKHLAPQQVAVVGMNTESNKAGGPTEAKKKAQKVQKDKKIHFAWLLDLSEDSLGALLGIDSIPRVVLLSPEGKVLFNGHPSDPTLAPALGKLGASLPQ